MSDINGILSYGWDTDGFQGLITTRQNFSSTTFPSESGATGSYYGETVRGMRFVSPLVEQKQTSLTVNDVIQLYFPDATTPLKEQGVLTYCDVDSKFEDVTSTNARFVYTKSNAPAYTVYLFYSKDAIKLAEAYECMTAKDKQVVFFIEDNTHDYSERYAAVKISPELNSSLKNGQEKDLKSNNNLYDYLQQVFPDLSDTDISQILHEGKLEYSGTLTIAKVIKGIYNFNTFILRTTTLIPFYGTKALVGKSPIKLISDALGWVVEHLEEIKVDNYRWDPTADKLDENGKPDATYNKEQDFSPFLLPGIEEGIDAGSDKMKAEFKKITASFLVQMNSQDDSVRQFLGIEGAFTENSQPNTMQEYVYIKYLGVTLAVKKQLAQIENIDFTDFAKLGVRIINAFLCGLWNGLIDAVCGLTMMVKYVFDAILLIDNFMDNIYTELPKLTEHMDNLRQGIEGIDLGKIMSHIIKGFTTFINSGSDSMLIKMAYFAVAVYGFVISLVVEIAIGILVSGGVLSIEAIIEKLVEMFTSLLRAVPNIAKGILKGATKITVKGLKFLYKMLTELTAFLKKGTDEIIKVIDELFLKMKAAVIVSSTVVNGKLFQ